VNTFKKKTENLFVYNVLRSVTLFASIFLFSQFVSLYNTGQLSAVEYLTACNCNCNCNWTNLY